MKTTIAACILITSAHAYADDAASALKRGQDELKRGRIHQACEAFEASDKLDAKLETELMLADCYAEDGKPVTAARLYRTLSDKDTNASRKKASLAKADKLEAKAPKLRFAINPRPSGLIIKVDGAEVASSGDVKVDIGPHDVLAMAPGYEGHASAAVDGDRPTVDVIIRMEPKAAEPAPMAKPAPTPKQAAEAAPEATTAPPMGAMQPMTDEPSGDHRKRNALIIGGAGVTLGVTAIVFGVVSQGKFDDEHKLCPHFECTNTPDVAKANSLQDDAKTYRIVAISTGIAGAAAIGVGAYLFLTARHDEPHVAVQVQHGGGGLEIGRASCRERV